MSKISKLHRSRMAPGWRFPHSRSGVKLAPAFLLGVTLLLSACETVPLDPGAAQVRITHDAADVASCAAVANVEAGCSPDGQKRTFENTIRNRTVGAGGNVVLVTNEWQGMMCGGIAYDCR